MFKILGKKKIGIGIWYWFIGRLSTKVICYKRPFRAVNKSLINITAIGLHAVNK